MNAKHLTFARKAFGDKKNSAGMPLFEHSVRVALTVQSLGYSPTVVSATLFHDILEDTDVDEQELLDVSNRTVLSLVRELTIEFDGRPIKEVVAPLYNISYWAIAIKLADILDNVTMSMYTYSMNKRGWYKEFWLPLLKEYEKMIKSWYETEGLGETFKEVDSGCYLIETIRDKITELRRFITVIK